MIMLESVLGCLITIFIVGAIAQGDPSYDNQNTTYTSQFQPVTVKDKQFTITPYFSPDTAIDVETKLVLEATNSIQIANPSFSSWISCTCNEYSSGCPAQKLREQETFPIFAALVNALHRGVRVNILTNNYNTPCKDGLVDPLSFLVVAGAAANYYKTTTFMHSKYIAVDGKKASVSSVNFTKTSFMQNREAGVIIEGPDAQPLLNLMNQTFAYDFAKGLPWPVLQYNESTIEIITNREDLPIPVPTKPELKDAYVTDATPVSGYMDVQIIDSPDFAWTTIFDALNTTQSSFDLYIYQVTTDDFCTKLLELSKRVSKFRMLVSRSIYDKEDSESAAKCYTFLTKNGVYVQETAEHMYRYSHQKYWIIDGEIMFLSTGNWGSTDYPYGSNVFPPYHPGSKTWRNTNRDFTVMIKNKDVVASFTKVLEEDYSRATQWKPHKSKLN